MEFLGGLLKVIGYVLLIVAYISLLVLSLGIGLWVGGAISIFNGFKNYVRGFIKTVKG